MHRILNLNLNLNKPIVPYACAMFLENHNNYNKQGPKILGGLGPHLTQSRLGRGLPPYQVASLSIQPFSRNGYGPKMGVCPLGGGELGPHLTQCGHSRGLPACQVSSWSVKPFGHNTPTLQTDTQDRQTGQTTDRQQRANRFTNGRPKTKSQKTLRAAKHGHSSEACRTTHYCW